MQLETINKKFENGRGKPFGYPTDMHYVVTRNPDKGYELRIEYDGTKASADIWKKADSWGLAAYSEIRRELMGPIDLRFVMPDSEKDKPKHEAFKRRLSYLAEGNKENFLISFITGGKEESLYPVSELFERQGEIVRPDFATRGDDDTAGHLEKDFQAYLFGKGLHDEEKNDFRKNQRLALFGKDFIGISKKNFGMEREFPTGAFDKEISKDTRILPTEFVDIVTINKNGELAVIEIKFDSAPLEAVAQLLNYVLFFYSYKAQITQLLSDRLQYDCSRNEIKGYLVSNVFHRRLSDVWIYYNCGPIPMQQVIMGYTPSK